MKSDHLFDQAKKLLASPSGPNPVVEVLDLINTFPKSSQPIRALAEHFRSAGKYELANIFVDLYEKYTDDPFYDSFAADIERSIIGFYLPEADKKQQGADACDRLSLEPGIEHYNKVMCRNNLIWYSNELSRQLPVDYYQLELNNQDGYISLNPSITTWKNKLWLIQRTVNYELNSEGNYIPVVDDNIRTRNWLCELDNNYKIINKYCIHHPVDWPDPEFGLVLGFEDSRLFVHNNELWTSSTVRELRADGKAQIVLAKIDMSNPKEFRYSDWKVVTPDYTTRLFYEKNWMPIPDQKEITWVYSSDPLRIINHKGETTTLVKHGLSADHWRGGSHAIPFRDGYLYLVHETIIPNYKSRTYLHRFVWCNSEWEPKRISNSFYFKTKGIEFVAGMTEFNEKLIVSFGHLDKESFLAEIESDQVWSILKPIQDNSKNFLAAAGLYSNLWNGTCLLNDAQVSIAKNLLAESGLPRHVDTNKNWDNLVALEQCLTHCDKQDPVLDVGATSGSAFLPGLWRMGYNKLISLNLSQKQDELINGVLYRNGDITKTDYPDEYFGYVACLSVIEHGIDQRKFFKEVFRITKPGARVCISTDYWSSPIDTHGKKMFDTDMIIFTPKDMGKMISIAEKNGFVLTKEFNPETQIAVINNMGIDYTFAVVVFEKPGKSK